METNSQKERDNHGRNLRKKTELALLIPILGMILLASPLIDGFTQETDESHTLTALFYIFGVWAALILSALVLSLFLAPELPDK